MAVGTPASWKLVRSLPTQFFAPDPPRCRSGMVLPAWQHARVLKGLADQTVIGMFASRCVGVGCRWMLAGNAKVGVREAIRQTRWEVGTFGTPGARALLLPRDGKPHSSDKPDAKRCTRLVHPLQLCCIRGVQGCTCPHAARSERLLQAFQFFSVDVGQPLALQAHGKRVIGDLTEVLDVYVLPSLRRPWPAPRPKDLQSGFRRSRCAKRCANR